MSATYAERASVHASAGEAERRRSRIVSWLRLATVLPGLGALIWGLAHLAHGGGLAVAAAVILLLAYATLVVRHARIEERAAWFDSLRLVNERAIARQERRWDALPPADAPPSIDLARHPYAVDLDLFGRASLFQFLGPAATPSGRATLARWIVQPADPDELAKRQSAVIELAAKDDWRERLAAHGVLTRDARQPEIDIFLDWAAGPGPFPRHRATLQALAIALTLAIWIPLALFLADMTEAAAWLIPLTIGIVLSFVTSKTIAHEFDRAGVGQYGLSRYADLFQHATGEPFDAPRLHDMREHLGAEGRAAPICMARLNRILNFAALRYSAALLHFPIQALTLWDFHWLFALDRWRAHVGSHVRGWMDALGELDGLAALAAVKCDNPDWAMPVIDPQPSLAAIALGHPLLADGRRIANDVEIGPPGTLLLVTGSNMSGKSTLLRAVGLNIVMAQAGGCVCASRLRLPPSDLQSSIRVQDSLELGLSYFMAALARLKGVVDSAEHPRSGRVLVYLLDEILQGTNSVERGIAVRAVARHLLDAGAIGAMTTHDLALASEEPLESAARLVHFTELVDEQGNMRFDYRLREGLATSRNALRLMSVIGIPLDPPTDDL